MIHNIESDLNRFRQIVKGRVRKDLKRFMSSGELIGKQGDQVVRIPLPRIGIPRFRYGKNEQGGVGQGQGGAGDPAAGPPGDGPGGAGDQPGEHALEADLTMEELAEILGEELELPRIEPRGDPDLASTRDRYTGIRRVGPEALRHNKRTFRAALKRQIASGSYAPDQPVVVPIKDDKRYRSWDRRSDPQSAAVVVYMMDVSGSMGAEQKEVVRLTAFWIDTWLRHNYENVQTRFIIHDAAAREVPREVFFRTKESGGTLISSAYKLCLQILEADYPAERFNIYPFHFSDGDNWSKADTAQCLELVERHLLPRANQFSYGQVDSDYGSGQFFKDLQGRFGAEEAVVASHIPDRDGIMNSIRDFLGKGR